MSAEVLEATTAPVVERGYWSDALRKLRRDRLAMFGLALVILLCLAAITAPLISPHDPTEQFKEGLSLSGDPLAPGGEFTLGTDGLGRDELSRVLRGAQVSLAVGIGANVIAALVGILVGGFAGFAPTFLQNLLMRGVDVILGFPVLLLAVAILAVSDPTLITIMILIGISFGAFLARIVFAQVVSVSERDYVLAARMAGVGTPTILVRHVVPHVLPSVLVFTTLGVATAIQLEAALAYVGVGIRAPEPSWGNMISEGQDYLLTSPWLLLIPGIAIVISMIGFSLLGDGLRDALDPTLSKGGRIDVGVR